MCASRAFWGAALVCLTVSCLSNFGAGDSAASQPSDQEVAQRVLGPQWKQLSRRAGMIFAGTVLAAAPPNETTRTAATDPFLPDPDLERPQSFQTTFRVDEAIAGVETGQILTIREWAGAQSLQRPMRKGQHFLIFFYPPSRLGLTSPVGGSQGQIALDQDRKNVRNVTASAQNPVASSASRNSFPAQPNRPLAGESVSAVQLERAIRSERNKGREE